MNCGIDSQPKIDRTISSSFLRTAMSARCSLVQVLLLTGMAALALAWPRAFAGPGAHGPNGEHLDAPAAGALAAQRPRVVAHSETFELAAELEDGRLLIIVDRFTSNEPVMQAELEVDYGGLKAVASLETHSGGFVVADEKLLTQLNQPGEHALVFTISAGAESDLLDGVLVNAGTHSARQDDRTHLPQWSVLGVAAAVLGALTVTVLRRRRLRSHRATQLPAVLVVLLPIFGLVCAWHQTAIAGPGAHGPNGEHLDAPGGPLPGAALARLPDGSVNVPKLAQRRMGIRTVVAPESEAATTRELPGRVIVDPNAGGRVQSLHGGRLEAGPRGLPVVGQRVTKGETLAFVRHHAEPYAMGTQQAQLAELQAQRKLTQLRVSRLEMLEGTVPRKELEAAREEAASLLERESRIGQSLTAREALTSPIDGVVARSEAILGQVLQERDVVFEVVDPGRLLVEATTADPTQAASVGQASLLGVEGVRLNLMGAARVMREGLLPLIFSVKPTGDLKILPLAIGQPVIVLAQTRQRVKGIALPAQAVVRSPANEPVVWIKSGAERFIPQPVRFHYLDSRTVLVVQGLSADNRVVVQGAPLIAQIR